jgi:putative transposase
MDKGTTNAIQGQIPQVVRSLDELAREGARRMIAAALELEVEEYTEKLRHLRDENGHALVVRNGKAKPRTVSLGAGPVELQAPRVDDRRPDHRFTSRILPPYMRRSPRLDDALPVLYLCGLSSGDFEEAIPVLLGADAAGFSPSTITRLTRVWQEEQEGWCKRPLEGKEYVYIWADGVYFGIRLGEDKQLACLVVVGVLPDGTKEVIALQDGYRESTDSWLSLLRDLKRRGMPAPRLAIGDGALGFWSALRQVYSGTKEQRCWVHTPALAGGAREIANILDKLPKRVQPRAKDMLHEIMYAPDRQSALEDIERFSQEFEAKYPKAVACLLKDQDELLTFFDFPAEHWIHLRTTNPIESTFSTVKARTKRTKGAGSPKAGLAMAFKLLLGAERRWRKINAPHLVALVRAGVSFPNGEQLAPKAA